MAVGCHPSTSLRCLGHRLFPGSSSQLRAFGLKGKSSAVIPGKFPLSGNKSSPRTMELSLVKLPHFTRGNTSPRGIVTSHKPELPATRQAAPGQRGKIQVFREQGSWLTSGSGQPGSSAQQSAVRCARQTGWASEAPRPGTVGLWPWQSEHVPSLGLLPHSSLCAMPCQLILSHYGHCQVPFPLT